MTNIGTIVNNIFMNMYGTRWAMEISGEHFAKFMSV